VNQEQQKPFLFAATVVVVASAVLLAFTRSRQCCAGGLQARAWCPRIRFLTLAEETGLVVQLRPKLATIA